MRNLPKYREANTEYGRWHHVSYKYYCAAVLNKKDRIEKGVEMAGKEKRTEISMKKKRAAGVMAIMSIFSFFIYL